MIKGGGRLWRLTAFPYDLFVDGGKAEGLRLELLELLRKQAEHLNAQSLGSATEAEIIDYELRQEVIHDLCKRLANFNAA